MQRSEVRCLRARRRLTRPLLYPRGGAQTVTSLATKEGTSYGPELLVGLRGGRRRAQLEDRLRELVREGTLAAGSRMPSSRALAGDLGVSRRLVVDAYAQLLAEGYLVSRQGAGTYVAETTAIADGAPPEQPAGSPQFDFFPGAPDLSAFPRTLWLRAMRDVLRSAPDGALAYPDARGAPELRGALSDYLRRVRGVVAEPDAIVVCSGATQGLALLGRALVAQGVRDIDVEDPGLPPHRAVLQYAGLRVRGVGVDEQGLQVDALRAGAVLATPAHQCPTGVVLSPRRRGELVRWAGAGGLVIEDDYDAEFRYDRAPLGALQGLAPEHVVYMGTVSKTLAPGMRLGWLVLPQSINDAVAQAKALDDLGCPVLDQLVLARLLTTSAYDRHLRRARRRNRARRDALITAVARELPQAHVSGISAGLHALVRLPHAVGVHELVGAAEQRSLRVYPLEFHRIEPARQTDALVMGYANLSEPAIGEGVRRLAEVLEEL
jgi:GntR family transcriptional regulator/MocR family aminotransferase